MLVAFTLVSGASVVPVLLAQGVTPTPVVTPFYPNRDLDLDLLPVFRELMQTNEDCVLPCWWGFRPGETTIDEIVAFLQETGFDRDWEESGLPMTLEKYLRVGEPFGLDLWDTEVRTIYSFGISFLIEDGHLRSMRIEVNAPDEWLVPTPDRVSLPYVLSNMDILPGIYISGLSTDSDLWLNVSNKAAGVRLNYNFDLRDNLTLEEPMLCFSIEQTDSIWIELSEPGGEELVHTPESSQNAGRHRNYSFEELYGIDTAAFRQFFIDNPGGCLNDLVSG
ncbi:MAG: hypothetical protein K8J31_31610 [Anaerolineae bacterium]|nr:hypothetical protein [Anaerolineae bacterium]